MPILLSPDSAAPYSGKKRIPKLLAEPSEEFAGIEPVLPEEPLSEFGEIVERGKKNLIKTFAEEAIKTGASTMYPLPGMIKAVMKAATTPGLTPLQRGLTTFEGLPYMPPVRDPIMAGIPGAIHAAQTRQDIWKGAVESTMTAPQPVAEIPAPWSPPPTEGKRWDWKRLLDEAHTKLRPDASPAEKTALYVAGSTLNLVSDPYMWGLEQGLVRALKAGNLPEIMNHTAAAMKIADDFKLNPPVAGVEFPSAKPFVPSALPAELPIISGIPPRPEVIKPQLVGKERVKPPLQEPYEIDWTKGREFPRIPPPAKPGIIERPALPPPRPAEGIPMPKTIMPKPTEPQKMLKAPPPPIRLPAPPEPMKGKSVIPEPPLPPSAVKVPEPPESLAALNDEARTIMNRLGFSEEEINKTLSPEPPPLPKKADIPEPPPIAPKAETTGAKPVAPDYNELVVHSKFTDKKEWIPEIQKYIDDYIEYKNEDHGFPSSELRAFGKEIRISDTNQSGTVTRWKTPLEIEEEISSLMAKKAKTFLKKKLQEHKDDLESWKSGRFVTEEQIEEAIKSGKFEDIPPAVWENRPDLAAKYGKKAGTPSAEKPSKSEGAPPPTPPEAVPKGEAGSAEWKKNYWENITPIKYGVESVILDADKTKIAKYLNAKPQTQGHSSFLLREVSRKFPDISDRKIIDFFDHLKEKSGKAIVFDRAAGLDTLHIDAKGKRFLSELLERDVGASKPSPLSAVKETLSVKTKQPGIFSGTAGATTSTRGAIKLAGTRAFRKAESAGKAVVQRLEDGLIDIYTTLKKGSSIEDARYDIRHLFGGRKAAMTPEAYEAFATAENQVRKGAEFNKNFEKVTTEYKDPKTGKRAIFDSSQQYRMWEYTTGRISKAEAMANVAKDPFEKVLIGRAKQVRQVLDELGLEQVDMDLMTEKAYFRRIGKYIPRLYEMHEAGLYDKMLKKWGVRRPGETFEGGGLKLDLQSYKNRHDNWGIRYSVKGKESSYRIGDPLDGTFDAIGGRKEFLTYVRGLKKTYGRDLKIIERWKPLTENQRLALGEIRRVDYPTAVAISRGKRNLAIKGFLDFVELHGEAKGLFSKIDPSLPGGNSWMKQLPNNKRFGNLAGKWVSAEIADALGSFGVMEPRFLTKFTNFMQRIYSPWRKFKTVYDPAVHMANIMSNGIAMDIFGHNPFSTISHGLKSYRLQDAWHKAADFINLFNGTFIEELGSLEKFYSGVKPPRSGIVGHLDNIMNKAKQFDGWTQKTYGAEEEVGKLGIFKNVLQKRFNVKEADLPMLMKSEEGKRMFKEAAEEANYIMLDYKNRPGLVKLWSNMPIVGSPFLTYYFYMIPRMAKAAIGVGRTGFDPMIALRFWKYPAMFGAVDAMSTAYLGLNKEEKAKVRANLPPYMQGTLEKGLQKFGMTAFPLLPFKSEYRDINTGQIKKEYAVLPTTRITPWGSTMLSETQGGMKWAGGDPLHNLYDAIFVTNKDNFTGIEVSKPFAKHPVLDKLNYAYRQITPSLAPGGNSFNKIWNSLVGKEDYAGRIRNPAMAFTDALLALKIQPVNVEREFQKRLRKVDADIIEIKTQLTELSKGQTRRGWDKADLEVEWQRLQGILAQKAMDRANIVLSAPLTAEGKRSTGKAEKFFPKGRKPKGFYTKPTLPPPPMKQNFGGIPSLR